MAAGLRRALPAAELDELPMADGGPGTLAALVAATSGEQFQAEAHDPLGRPIRAGWGAFGGSANRTAVVEMATASGLVLLSGAERDPERTSTRGTGELLRAALDSGYREIIVGVGGSATNDGGAGMAQALGARLLDEAGRELAPGGGALQRLARVDIDELDSRLRETHMVVATDVANSLCGPAGASLVYGPQKGASETVAERLDAALAHYAEIVRRDLGVDVAGVPGAGAAGGLGAGLIAFCGAEVRSGFEVVAEAVGLRERVRLASAVVTGEGRLDRQTDFGKTVAGVARVAREESRPVVAVVGSREEAASADAFDAVFAIVPELAPADDAMTRASELLSEAADAAGRWLAAHAAS